jgi:hypothetical protein
VLVGGEFPAVHFLAERFGGEEEPAFVEHQPELPARGTARRISPAS